MKCIFLFFILLVSSCRTGQQIEDWRTPSEICEVHQIKMTARIVHDHVGCITPLRGYVEDMKKFFPNCSPVQISKMKGNSKGKVYVCLECDKANNKWTNTK